MSTLHITSFRSRQTVIGTGLRAQAAVRSGRPRDGRPIGGRVGRGPRAPRSMNGSSAPAAAAAAGIDRGRPGARPGAVDPAPFGRQPLGDRQSEAAGVVGSGCHSWTVPLPNDSLADERRAARVLERAGDDLAGGGAAAVDQHDELRSPESVASPPACASAGRLCSLGVLLPEDRAVPADELAGHLRARGRRSHPGLPRRSRMILRRPASMSACSAALNSSDAGR